MGQDRFSIDRAVSRAAPTSSPPPKKPTATGNALALARCVSIACSVACGVAVFLGIFPQGSNTGALNYVLPFIAAPILAFGMASAWHVAYGVGAHATELHRQVICLAFGAGLFLVGCSTSAWFLAAKIGGAGAIEAYQNQAVERLKRAGEVVAGNASADAALLAAVEHGGDALRIAAVSEDKTGVVARGRTGKGVAFRGLSDAAESMAKVASDMRQQAGARGDLLTVAQTSMSEAERDAATGDAAGFEQAFAKASETLNAAEKIRLSAAASSLGIGLAVDRSAAPHVNATLQEIEKVRQLSNSNRRAIVIPVYTAIDDRQAVLNAPQPLAWIAAVMIEALPLAMLGLLLLLWRDDDQQPPTSGTASDWLPPLFASRPQSASHPIREAAE